MKNDSPEAVLVKMKLTIAKAGTPELFHALHGIAEPRQRGRRLQDLALMGLLFEREMAQRQSAQITQPFAPPARTAVGPSVTSMVDWESTDRSDEEGMPSAR